MNGGDLSGNVLDAGDHRRPAAADGMAEARMKLDRRRYVDCDAAGAQIRLDQRSGSGTGFAPNPDRGLTALRRGQVLGRREFRFARNRIAANRGFDIGLRACMREAAKAGSAVAPVRPNGTIEIAAVMGGALDAISRRRPWRPIADAA
jgi:hypothetical protein